MTFPLYFSMRRSVFLSIRSAFSNSYLITCFSKFIRLLYLSSFTSNAGGSIFLRLGIALRQEFRGSTIIRREGVAGTREVDRSRLSKWEGSCLEGKESLFSLKELKESFFCASCGVWEDSVISCWDAWGELVLVTNSLLCWTRLKCLEWLAAATYVTPTPLTMPS